MDRIGEGGAHRQIRTTNQKKENAKRTCVYAPSTCHGKATSSAAPAEYRRHRLGMEMPWGILPQPNQRERVQRVENERELES